MDTTITDDVPTPLLQRVLAGAAKLISPPGHRDWHIKHGPGNRRRGGRTA